MLFRHPFVVIVKNARQDIRLVIDASKEANHAFFV